MNDSTIDDANSQSGYQSEKIGSYKDAVSAVIDVSSKVTAQTGDISVVASDVINANMFSGKVNIALANVAPTVTGGISGSGIVVITGTADGDKITITADGTGKAYAIYKVPTISISGISMTIANAAGGTLRVTCSGGISSFANAATKVYSAVYVPCVTIVNQGNYNISIAKIDLFNESISRPTVIVGGSYYVSSVSGTGDASSQIPVVTITTEGTGNVTVSGTIQNPNGSVTIRWTGAEGGSLYGGSPSLGGKSVASIWANALTVTGAANIGTSTVPLTAYLTVVGDTKDATVFMTAGTSATRMR